MAVSCKFCNAEAPDDAIFCEACGQKLESPAADSVPTVACPACGTANPPDSAFCEECGGAIPDNAEKGGRKPGFLGLAAKAGAGGIALGGAGVGLSSVLGGGGGAAASGAAGAGAAEAGAEAAGEALGQAAGEAGASAGGTAGGPLAGGPSAGAGTPGGGPSAGGPTTGGGPPGVSSGQPPIKPDLAQPPSTGGPGAPTGSSGTGTSGAPTSGTPPGGAPTGAPPGGTATGAPPGGAPTGAPTGGSTVGTPPGAGASTGVPGGGGAAGAQGATGTGFTVPDVRHHHHGGGAGHAGAAAGAAGAGAAGVGILGVLGMIIKIGLIGIIAIVGVGLGASLVGAALIFTGNPSPCVDRAIEPSTAASQALRDQWDAFEAEAAGGSATIAFDEVGVTSRGVEYIDEKDLPLEDLQVHFCPDGLGEALGTINTPGPDIHVVMRGTLDLSGEKPRIDVREIKAGNLPGLFGGTDWIVNNIVKKSNADILDVEPHLLSLEIEDGSATLTGGPP